MPPVARDGASRIAARAVGSPPSLRCVAHMARILGVASFLHTMVRVTDPAKSRAFYEALGFRFSRDMDIVRDGELEATNYFFSIGDAENVLELTFNHDGRTYDLGSALRAHRDRSGRPRRHARSSSPTRASSPSGRPTRWSRAARGSASSAIRMSTASSSSAAPASELGRGGRRADRPSAGCGRAGSAQGGRARPRAGPRRRSLVDRCPRRR